MWISYKDIDSFRLKGSQLSVCTTLFPKEKDCDECYQTFTMKCDPELMNRWENMMENGITPLEDMKSQYSNFIPKYNLNFLQSLSIFIRMMPKEGLEIIDYILNGTVKNLTKLDWHIIFTVLINNLPYSMPILSHALSVPETSKLKHISIFLKMGVLPSLYQFSKKIEYHLILSFILLSLSSYELTSYQSKVSLNESVSLSSYEKRNTEIEEDLFFSESENEDDDTAFITFCENLLVSEDDQVRLNVLIALLTLCEHDIKCRSLISNLMLAYLIKLRGNEERLYVLKILSVSFKGEPDSLFPLIQNMAEISAEFVKSNDYRLIDAICGLIEKIMENDCEDYFWQLGVANKFYEIVTADCPFEIKKNALVVLLRLTNVVDSGRLINIVTLEMIEKICEFLEYDEDSISLRILNFVSKLIYQKETPIPSEFLDLFLSWSEKIFSLTMSENPEISAASSSIMRFLESL
ncbi:hypothetical protein TRFO_41434 [Tritrichomonas foetus]|uniref:Uncharacterized protein n=1 Tax=Tritrichomonas foetus TaxID=1144522 RepID=A0A1J4L4V5_9EUKA|nr:hypothetical protein TRFO_41434 [Tritrichomonas foetus]|eukprot:OHT16966.1 hypothetical protein TRFO_41434 [Tritrichomonas foetus]